MLFSSFILVTLKFAAGRQVCHPSRAKLGLKDSTIELTVTLLKTESEGKTLLSLFVINFMTYQIYY
jgi:hypothetical protein